MNSFFEDTLSKIGIPIEDYGARITIFGFKGIHIEGHKGLIDYTDSEIVFRVKNKTVYIYGERLAINEISPDEIFVKGNIKSIGAEKIG